MLPVLGRLRTLDLSHNSISRVGSYALGATLTPDCSAPVDFRAEGNPCACRLNHTTNGYCNNVVCECTEPETVRVACGPTVERNESNTTIWASQVCDGFSDCDNCWDEGRRACSTG
jgi:hypothetical protein